MYDGETYRVALRPQIFIKSYDNGLTWEPAKVAIMRSNEIEYLTEPYISQVIAKPDRDGIAQRFHFIWTLAAGIALWIDSGGTVHSDYHNGHSKNIYHAYRRMKPVLLGDKLITQMILTPLGLEKLKFKARMSWTVCGPNRQIPDRRLHDPGRHPDLGPSGG